MKKLLTCFLFLLALAGCKDAPKPVKPEDMNAGYVHFAASLILEDVIHKGDASVYAQLVQSRPLSPYKILYADNVIGDFRRDFSSAEDRYYRLRGTGAVVRGTVAGVDKAEQEVIFVKEDVEGKPPFTGTLRISLDREFYKDGAMPAYETGAAATFMCTQYRPVHDFKNETMHKVEIRMIECKSANDYYGEVQDRIKERLTDIYAGRESVNPDLAKGLAALYLTGQSVPEDSVCLYGGYLACHENLVDEFARKWGEVKVENIGNMDIDPEKVTSRKIEQVKSGPAERPENADRSPSGEKIHEQPEGVTKQKEAISRVKVPGAD
ncbi:hypothetical protein NB640_12065 [Oxalobacter vibrioformis]|uniref:Lipoprotein n=1 Tax=Oxalobacter vibrioformis TaxID=933080 RepID=A0A9E9LYP8_9BURK|nr:hypothetical protein [Oxalobacter vibrioformis]WAW09939.1 hypothetical protein NB640_12065 [Oxalobacter vibrioformis]